MRIQLLSDLHLEVDPGFVPEFDPKSDLLVLAGDIGARPDTPMASHGDPKFCLTRFSPALGHWPVPVLYIPGNHEYDGQDVDECREALRDVAEQLGIHWLDQQSLLIDGVRFLGTTLWSDFDCFGDQPSHVPGSMSHNLRQRERCFRTANHYLQHTGTARDGVLFDAAAMRDESLSCQRWLRDRLAESHTGPTVVVTHFAPSLRSHDPRFGLTPGTAGFCNALDELLPFADVWLHGHLHCPSDYRVGGCRVYANPLGYAAQGEQVHFNPRGGIEI